MCRTRLRPSTKVIPGQIHTSLEDCVSLHVISSSRNALTLSLIPGMNRFTLLRKIHPPLVRQASL